MKSKRAFSACFSAMNREGIYKILYIQRGTETKAVLSLCQHN